MCTLVFHPIQAPYIEQEAIRFWQHVSESLSHRPSLIQYKWIIMKMNALNHLFHRSYDKQTP